MLNLTQYIFILIALKWLSVTGVNIGSDNGPWCNKVLSDTLEI